MAKEIDYPSRRTATNDVTGALIKTRPASEAYMDNYDRIFRKKEKEEEVIEDKDQQ